MFYGNYRLKAERMAKAERRLNIIMFIMVLVAGAGLCALLYAILLAIGLVGVAVTTGV